MRCPLPIGVNLAVHVGHDGHVEAMNLSQAFSVETSRPPSAFHHGHAVRHPSNALDPTLALNAYPFASLSGLRRLRADRTA